jgi:antitoxin component YwqK of YwqJK toxin-antitoxin module
MRFFLLVLLSYGCFSQTNEIANLQKFIAATVQIPFKAQVANVQANVAVRVTFSDSVSFTTQIVKGLREDCDKEALRVVGLINAKNLRTVLGSKNTGIVEVPFFNAVPFLYQNGKIVDYFDKDNKPTTNPTKAKYIRQYAVDTLTGAIMGNIEWLEIKKKGNERIKTEVIIIDSTKRYRPRFLESPADTLRVFETHLAENKQTPPIIAFFENGRLRQKTFDGKMYLYYPNGRISNSYEFNNEEIEPKMIDTHWFYNGQMAFIRHRKQNEPERYISVWDSTGRQLVAEGNGLDEYYEVSGRAIVKISGMMKNGLKEGLFKGTSSKGVLLFEGYYSKGNLVKGLSFERWGRREQPL